MFLAAFFIIAPNWKEPRCSTIGEWIKKKNLWSIHTMGCCLVMEKKELWIHTIVMMNPKVSCLIKEDSGKMTHTLGFI